MKRCMSNAADSLGGMTEARSTGSGGRAARTGAGCVQFDGR
jgi:hypothetical protein